MTSRAAPLPTEPRVLWRTVVALAAGVVSMFFIKLGLFAVVGTFITWASLPRLTPRALRRERLILGLAAAASSVGLVRFIAVEAVAGIVQGGSRFTEQRAISRLREVLFAQDSARRLAHHDPDRDGVGSAALLGELTGELPLRGERALSPPLLESYPRQSETPIGPATDVGGYLLIVCLPEQGGGFTARPGSHIDDELAERRFIAYAWPSGAAPGLTSAVALDEHERILVAPSRDGLRSGYAAPPSCSDAVDPATSGAWTPWRNKQPRTTLPGDR